MFSCTTKALTAPYLADADADAKAGAEGSLIICSSQQPQALRRGERIQAAQRYCVVVVAQRAASRGHAVRFDVAYLVDS